MKPGLNAAPHASQAARICTTQSRVRRPAKRRAALALTIMFDSTAIAYIGDIVQVQIFRYLI